MLGTIEIENILGENFYEKVTFLPALCSQMKIIENDTISFVDSTVTSDTFNVAYLKNKNILSEKDIQAMINYYKVRNYSFALWISPRNFDSDVEKFLRSAGLLCVESEVGMAANIKDIAVKMDDIEDFSVNEVCDVKSFKDYGFVMGSVFTPFDTGAVSFYEKISGCYRKNEKYHMFIGYMNGEPAAISCVITTGGFGGIYDVVTNPRFQRRGLGKHMTLLATKKVKELGCNIVGMQASTDGQPIYKKLGFNPFGTFKVYS